MQLLRRFVHLGDREVHYLQQGEGPPLVLIHASPYNAWAWQAAMSCWSQHHTCLAFDTPGFGLSDPLPEERMNVVALADAMADTLRALGLSGCAVVGSHTGAAIALELARRHPLLVSGVVLEGLPIFLEEEKADWFAGNYFAPLAPSEYGEHLTWAWTRVRDCDLYFPWITRTPENFYSEGRGSAEKLHQDVTDYFECAAHYRPAYRSAVMYDAAAEALQAIDQPALITASSADLMFPHMDRLGVLKPDQVLLKLGPDPQDFHQAVATTLERFVPGHFGEPTAPSAAAGGVRMTRRFVDLAEGPMLVRMAGSGSGAPVLIIPDAPGSGRQAETLLRTLGRSGQALCIDLPGTGESAPLTSKAPTAADYADAIGRICDTLSLTKVRVLGLGFGSAIAMAFAEREPGRVERIALASVLMADAAERARLLARYAPPIQVQANGSHWYDCWLMLRDSLTQWPWYDGGRAAMRRVPEPLDANALHRWTVDVMKQHGTYGQPIRAALNVDLPAVLRQARHPVLLCRDPRHRFPCPDEMLPAPSDQVTSLTGAADHPDTLAWLTG